YEVELDKADILLVVLEGVEAEAWTGFECGYARAKGKYIFGITSEENADDVAQERFTSMCDELIFYTSGDDVKKSHSEIASALASHVMMRAQWGDVATPAAVPTS
ncbi:MAG: nucleoside 2-deoxyribosyltransferase, partial [Halieaceae bacterium]